MNKINFNSSDSWLLLSILCTKEPEGTDILSIISTGDYINHAIFTYDEIKDGLNKLELTGYINIKNELIYLTSKAKELNIRKKSIFKLQDMILEKLNKNNKFNKLPRRDITKISFNSYKKALSDYSKLY